MNQHPSPISFDAVIVAAKSFLLPICPRFDSAPKRSKQRKSKKFIFINEREAIEQGPIL